MKNLFLAYKHTIILSVSFFSFLFVMIGLWGSYYIFAEIILIFCFSYEYYKCFTFNKFFKAFSNVCENLKKGDFESRIVLPKEKKIINVYIDKFNNVIDVCDAFVRESSLTMKAVSEERFHRKIRHEGFSGAYNVGLKRINHGVDLVEEKAKQEKMLKSSIDLINEAVLAGNLDVKLSTADFSQNYLPLVKGLNELIITISTPLKESIDVLKAISNGDFTQTMKGEYLGYFKELQLAFEQTTTNLSKIINSINSISSSVHFSSQSIVKSSAEISEKAEAQASALQETAASIEELSSTVRQNSQNATESEKLAQNVQSLTLSAHHIMDETVTSMKSIKESADKIQGIIEFLDGISSQTNMLALNAAIEAARAGSSGKGFAVVADEVRTLAKKSAEASHEMKELLKNSHTDIQQGVTLVLKTNESLNGIFESVKKVTAMVSDIATATIEQTTGIEQINIAVCQLDEVTQINSASASANYSSTESLNNNAKNLREIVGRLKIKDVNQSISSNR